MDEKTLNILAIGIFTMTISTLLSPILNISPFVPAGITFGFLGLATVDTLSWQGRGMTLFLDFFAGAMQRERVVYHEAGHFLAAYFLGVRVDSYTLTAWESFRKGNYGKGGVIFANFDLDDKSPNMRLTFDRFCTVLMAGIAAEKLIYNNVEGGVEDRQELKMALDIAGLPLSLYSQKERWGQLQATNLLERNQDSYQALVEAMKARKSVTECYEVIQSTIS